MRLMKISPQGRQIAALERLKDVQERELCWTVAVSFGNWEQYRQAIVFVFCLLHIACSLGNMVIVSLNSNSELERRSLVVFYN